MGLDDLARKAKEAWQHEKVQNAIRSEKAEGVSDSVLDKVADAADRATGGRYADQVAGARRAADERIGTPSERPAAAPTTDTEPPSTPDPSTPDPEPERSPEPGAVPEPGTVPGAPGDPTAPPTTPPTEPPTRPTGPAGV
jgi:hypothetical protein